MGSQNATGDKQAFKDLLWESGLWEELNHDQLIKLDKVIDAYTEQRVAEARLDEAKHNERAVAKKFDQLCERVRTDPYFGNSTKGKKDNFLDGAESMVILPSVRRAELEAQLKASTSNRKVILAELINEEKALYEIYGDDQQICVGIKLMADAIREKYDE